MPETLDLYIRADGQFAVRRFESSEPVLPAAAAERIASAFAAGPGRGLMHLVTAELKTVLPPGLSYARAFARDYVTALCHHGDLPPEAPLDVPEVSVLSRWALEAPALLGLEYLDTSALAAAWRALEASLRAAADSAGESPRAHLHTLNPLWRLVGRVTLHLAENRRDERHPFAFLATYVAEMSRSGQAQHLPLGEALKIYAGAAERKRLVSLLTPIRDAAERLPWVHSLLESGDLYHPLAWSAAEAYRLLRDAPVLEQSGLAVRVPDWWHTGKTVRPQVSVSVGSQAPPALGAASLLDFSVGVTLEGEALSETELRQLAQAADGLVRLRGRWVEADGEKLAAALEHWRSVAREAAAGGLSFYDGMRLLAGAAPGAALTELPEALREWSGIEAGPGLRARLERLRHPEAEPDPVTAGVTATLRPYQKTGVKWLRLMSELGLGACLADDMGLGKTLQVIALLAARTRADGAGPSLVIAPASLLANWQNEFARFAPKLRTLVAHPAESDLDLHSPAALGRALQKIDVTITTYGLIGRCEALRKQAWDVLVLDEAQAIKNPGARQTRAVKTLQGRARIALTGTPIENRLSDLWSLFDFLNPGLLGSARVFAEAAKRLAKAPEAYAPLRRLVQPYILRRLKTDRRVIADLPEKTELNAYCGLTREQAALYQRCVRELARTLERAEGMARRGAVLAHLMQLKQICNHPAQWAGEARCAPERSGKFLRLAELCGELAERQARVLVFTQFREIIAPLEAHLAGIFGRPGLTLHGGTAVRERQRLVERFQREDGPPFFILSLKAGGTGLNLTAAAHVIHFDRWWNPAVENQATDRAFRIGQRRNVLVHKFICRGTIEEKIAALIEAKQGLAQELLGEGAERLLTEMSDAELLSMVALDLNKACEA